MRPVSAARLVSLVIPTLREDEIAVTLTAIGEHLAALPDYDFEILLVDDSAESFKRLMDEATRAFDARFGPRLTARRADGPHKGKGAAVRVGVLASRGEFVFWMDADLPVPLDNIDRFLRLFDDDRPDFIVAERPFDRNLSQPVRFVASRVLFAFQRALVFQSRAFDDTQCGFKAFRGDLARRIAGQQIVDGGMADIEYLYAALRSGARPARVAVIPNPETRASKINVKRALVVDPIDLVRIKLRSLRGGLSRMIRLRQGVAVAIFFALLAVVFLSVFPYIGAVNNPNENVRTYTTIALVEDHTFRIDQEVQDYGHVNDMARVPQPDGTSRLFSMKGPANAYAGVPVYWAMRKLASRFHLHPPGPFASPRDRAAWLETVTFVLRFFTVQIPCFLFLVWFERWLRRTTGDLVLRLSAVLAAGLGTNYLAYSLMFVSHALFAVASFVAFGVTLDQWAAHPAPARRSAGAAFVVGFGAGWAVLLDYQALPISFIVVVFAACVFRRGSCLLAMAGGGAIHVAAMMLFQWRAFGNPLTPGHKFAETAAFHAEHNRGIYGIDVPDLHVLAQLCFSRAWGFFGTSPYTWLGLLAIPFALFSGYGPPAAQQRRRVATFLWVLAMTILFVSVTGKTNWHGGWSIGPRYYGAAPPFFAFGAVAALEWFARKAPGNRTAARALSVGLALASVAQTGLVSMLYNTLPENITRPFAQAALPLTITGFVPHHIFELLGLKSTAPFYFVLGCLAVATLLPLALRTNESLLAWIARLVAALAVAAFALIPAFSIPAKEELDQGTGAVGWLTTIWEPQGRDRITTAREEAERFGPRRPCAWMRVARMEKLIGLTGEAARDEAKAGAVAPQCTGATDRMEELLLTRLSKIAGHTPTP